MSWKAVLINRFTLTFGVVAAAALAWNVYVSFHNGGSFVGRIVDPAGHAVAGAKVTLLRKSITSVEPVAETVTDADGRFAFRDHGQFSLMLTVDAPAGSLPRQKFPLWFRNQDVDIGDRVVGG